MIGSSLAVVMAISGGPAIIAAMPVASPPETVAAPASGQTASDASDIVVTARSRHPAADPLGAVNAFSFGFTQQVDGAFIAPVAMAYQRTLPAPVRSGLRNFLANLHEPIVFANYLLQLKPGKAAETLGRFAINSTIGAAGLFDTAARKPFGLPRRPNGFADTLGYYGVRPGAFMFLPLIGPTTIRDLLGSGVDRAMLPFTYLRPFNRPAYLIPSATVRTLDRRAELDEQLSAVRDSSDPYATRRDVYLSRRQAEIDALHGRR